MPIKDMWVEKIYIIAHKEEQSRFDFYTERRAWDGFVYFLGGCGYYLDADKQRVEVGANDLVLVRRGQSYGFLFEEGCEYITTAFDIGEDADSAGVSTRDACGVFRARGELRELVCSLCDADTQGDRASVRARLCEVLDRLLRTDIGSAEAGYDRDVERAVEFIRARSKENFSAEELSRYCSVSQSYLRAQFKRATGQSFSEYRESLRITEAKYMLESGFFEINEIAHLLGYTDVYHFSKRFTTYAGISPGKYKKSFHTKK